MNRIEPKFPKATGGNPCDGRVIFSPEGKRIGVLRRDFEYVDRGIVQCSYVNKVVGYIVEEWATDKEHLFETLAAATAFARTIPAPTK